MTYREQATQVMRELTQDAKSIDARDFVDELDVRLDQIGVLLEMIHLITQTGVQADDRLLKIQTAGLMVEDQLRAVRKSRDAWQEGQK